MPTARHELTAPGPPALRPAARLPLHPLYRLRALWGAGLVLPLLPALYALVLVLAHATLRAEHVGFALVALALGYIGPRSAALYRALLPFVVTALGYDCVRYARVLFVRPERVLACGLRNLDRSLVSVHGLSLPEWFARHHSVPADLAAAVPYAAFVYIALGYAVWLWFRDRAQMQRFLWAFAFANAISFVTWLALPAAPPWYVLEHGCAIDLLARPSPAGLARVDQLLGFAYFARFYSRAASVFGALPSMHCAYPMLGLFTAWGRARWRERVLHLGYAAWMASAAIYLGHHWVVDALAGWATAALGAYAALRLSRPRSAAAT